jgi:hypothetical protein
MVVVVDTFSFNKESVVADTCTGQKRSYAFSFIKKTKATRLATEEGRGNAGPEVRAVLRGADVPVAIKILMTTHLLARKRWAGPGCIS